MTKSDTRIVFMGTPDIAASLLKSLFEDGYNIIAVIAQPDRAVGRKRIITPVPTKVIANEYNVPTYQPERIKNDYEFVKELKPDLIITLAYGQIVPQGLLDIPKLGAINFHGSLLPKYRGAAPMQYALLNNDKVTGFSLMEMTKEMDAGGVYAVKECLIDDNDNYTSLLTKMTLTAIALAKEALPLFIEGRLNKVEQDISKITFAPTIKPEEERIDINKDIYSINGQIRALSDKPGAYLYIGEDKFKIYKANIIPLKIMGEVLTVVNADKKGLYIQFKDGILSILELQKDGKNRMDYISLLNGDHTLLNKKVK